MAVGGTLDAPRLAAFGPFSRTSGWCGAD
jgi:hypothetical protein